MAKKKRFYGPKRRRRSVESRIKCHEGSNPTSVSQTTGKRLKRPVCISTATGKRTKRAKAQSCCPKGSYAGTQGGKYKRAVCISKTGRRVKRLKNCR